MDDFGVHYQQGIRYEFHRLREQWEEETTSTSDSIDLVLHPAYQMIIGLGSSVVPHILADLQKRPQHWDWALRSITRQNPVPPSAEGDIEAITDAWLAWGSARCLI